MAELTAAQEVQAQIYATRYIAIGLKNHKEGTTNRHKAAKAMQDIYHLSGKHKNKKYAHFELKEFKSGNDPIFLDYQSKKTLAIPKPDLPHSFKMDPKTVYILTGKFDDLKHVMSYWNEGLKPQDALRLAQHAVHSAAYAMFVINVIGLDGADKEHKELCAHALDDYSRNVGCTLQYENMCVAGDLPVFHVHKDEGIKPIWSNRQAAELGIDLSEVDYS